MAGRYRANDYRTPYEKLISLKKWAQCIWSLASWQICWRGSPNNAATPRRSCTCKGPNWNYGSNAGACRKEQTRIEQAVVGGRISGSFYDWKMLNWQCDWAPAHRFPGARI